MSETPPRKRQRVSQACNRCRVKKYRCDGGRPACVPCADAALNCSYGTVVKRRGLRTGYVKILESLLTLLFLRVSGSQDVVYALLRDLSITVGQSSEEEDGSSSMLLQQWRDGGMLTAIERHLDHLPLDAVRPGDRNQDSVCEDNVGLIPLVPQWAVRALESTGRLTEVLPDEHRIPEQDMQSNISSEAVAAKPWPPLPDDWHILVQIYLSTEHAWLPLIDRHCLFRIAYTYRTFTTSETELTDCGRGEFACLWAVLTLGEIHSCDVEVNRIAEIQHVSSSFLAIENIAVPHLSHIQTLILWSVIHLGCQEWLRARLLVAHAVVLALHNEAISEERTRMLRCCSVLDILVSIATGTTPIMAAMSLPVMAPQDESTLEEWEPYTLNLGRGCSREVRGHASTPGRVCSTYNQFVKLLYVLRDAMCGGADVALVTTLLEDWRMQRPAHLSAIDHCDSRASIEEHPPHAINVSLFHQVLCHVIAERRNGELPAMTRIQIDDGPGKELSMLLLAVNCHYSTQAFPAACSVIMHLLLDVATSTLGNDSLTPHVTAIRNLIHTFVGRWTWSPRAACALPGHHMSSGGCTAVTRPPLPDRVSGRPWQSPVEGNTDLSMNGRIDGQNTNAASMRDGHAEAQSSGKSADNIETSTHSLSDNNFLHSTAESDLPPDQLLDYLTLLEANENSGSRNDQSFMESLGFFGDIQYADL